MAQANTSGGTGRGERARRASPERNGPDRAGAADGGSEGGDDLGSCPPPDEAFPEVSEVVAEAVRLGYRVVEENLRQGRLAADRLRAGDYDVEDARDDVVKLGRRFVDLARDLGTSWFDLIGALLDDPRLIDAVRSKRDDRDAHRRDRKVNDDDDATCRTPVEVVGHPTAFGEALLSDPARLTRPPQVTPLRLIDGPAQAPAIMGTRLGAASETGALALIVPVPPDQASGTYTGTIYETGSKRLLGSVSLTVP